MRMGEFFLGGFRGIADCYDAWFVAGWQYVFHGDPGIDPDEFGVLFDLGDRLVMLLIMTVLTVVSPLLWPFAFAAGMTRSTATRKEKEGIDGYRG